MRDVLAGTDTLAENHCAVDDPVAVCTDRSHSCPPVFDLLRRQKALEGRYAVDIVAEHGSVHHSARFPTGALAKQLASRARRSRKQWAH